VTTGHDPPIELPRLAVFHHENSDSMMQVFLEAREWCRIVWVVGWSPDVPSLRALRRFGEVADLSGMAYDESVAHVVALRPDGVLVLSDQPMRLAAEVAERLGLPFHSPHSAALLTDKFLQRTALREAGVPVPAYAPVRAGDLETTVPFPAVLKPRAGAGSRDTFKVENPADLAQAMAGCDPDEEFILEEWLADRAGTHSLGSDVVSVETVVRRGVVSHIAVTGRFPFAPPFRETGSFLPSDLGSADQDAVRTVATAAAEALGITEGILHIEIKMTPNGPRLVEVNGRIGGGISELLLQVGGPSLRMWGVRLALGQDVGPIPAVGDSPIAYFRWIVAPPTATMVEAVDGVKELGELAGIDEVRLNRRPGDRVNPREGSPTDHVVRIIGLVATPAELSHLIFEKIDTTLRITWGY
jgi:biotin carboxylase